MTTSIPAIFEHGAFVPRYRCEIPEGTLVNLSVEIRMPGPAATDPDERRRIPAEVIKTMRASPIPANAPRLMREELAERR